MASAIIAVVGSLVGVLLGFLVQGWHANRAHKWHLDDWKKDAYVELLRSISASYAQAYSREGTSEDANILRATAVIELLAGTTIADKARQLQGQVDRAHRILREEGYKTAKDEIDKANHDRLELIELLQPDLGIKPTRMTPR